jgi:hypothetical protein
VSSRQTRSVAEILAGVVATLASAAGVFVALFVDAMRCDEGCSDHPFNWGEDPNAWQWDGQLVLAGVAGLVALFALGLAIAGSRRSLWALATSIALWATWWIFATSY